MSWNAGFHRERLDERDYAFELDCSCCGATRLNTDGDYCTCGSSHVSYDARDADRWNDHADAQGWR